jgi:replicative DNA helicase
MIGRSPPADTNAERATLGALLLERDAILAVASVLAAEHFYLERHAWIYEAVLACYQRRVPPDISTVSDELRRQRVDDEHTRLDLVGGFSYLAELSIEVPTAVHVEYYAQIVIQAAVRRQLIETGGKITALGYDEHDELETTLDQAEQALFAVTQRPGVQQYIHIRRSLDALYERFERVSRGDDHLSGVPTGFLDMDAILAGMQRTDLLVLAARPGVGKTALALSIARNVAQRGGTVGLVSMEMSAEQLTERLVSMGSGLNLQRMRSGRLAPDDFETAFQAMGELSNMNILIDDECAQRIQAIRSKARHLHTQRPLDLLVVDYLQLAEGQNPKNDHQRVQSVTEISRGLKALARDLHCPVLALSQLSRAVEGRTSRVPLLSDLRDSGSIEQDADVVMFIYREELYDKTTDKKGIAEIHIAKHRNGPLGVAQLRFDPDTTSYQNLARYQTPPGYSAGSNGAGPNGAGPNGAPPSHTGN